MGLALLSCQQSEKEEIKEDKEEEEIKLPLEQMVKRHIEGKLSIPANENYSYKIYRAHLDGDTLEDAIITVNRLSFAMNEANASKNTAKQAELGFMGNYNYIFFFDGGLHMISPPIAIPSSPLAPLKVEFENISSPDFKDILVHFRILNASYMDVYTIGNHIPRRIFQWKNFDGLNSTKNVEAFTFEFVEGTTGPVKDILVKKAELIQPKNEINIYEYSPEIKGTNEIVHRFFYIPKEGKYLTQKR